MSQTKNQKGPSKITKEAYEKETLTRGKLIPIIEDLKDFIKSTSRGTENVLRKEMQHMEKSLRNDMQTMEKRLSDKIDNVGSKFENHETRLSTVEEKLDTHLTTH